MVCANVLALQGLYMWRKLSDFKFICFRWRMPFFIKTSSTISNDHHHTIASQTTYWYRLVELLSQVAPPCRLSSLQGCDCHDKGALTVQKIWAHFSFGWVDRAKRCVDSRNFRDCRNTVSTTALWVRYHLGITGILALCYVCIEIILKDLTSTFFVTNVPWAGSFRYFIILSSALVKWLIQTIGFLEATI